MFSDVRGLFDLFGILFSVGWGQDNTFWSSKQHLKNPEILGFLQAARGGSHRCETGSKGLTGAMKN